MAEVEVQFRRWSSGPTTVPRAVFEVTGQDVRSFTVELEVPESVRSRLAATEQGDDEPDERFVERIQTALRGHGQELVGAIADDPDRRRTGQEEGHLVHEVAGHEIHRLTAHLSDGG